MAIRLVLVIFCPGRSPQVEQVASLKKGDLIPFFLRRIREDQALT